MNLSDVGEIELMEVSSPIWLVLKFHEVNGCMCPCRISFSDSVDINLFTSTITDFAYTEILCSEGLNVSM